VDPVARGACTVSHEERAAAPVTGIVLAGGQGRRMGGVDKGLVELGGRPMVAHVLDRIGPQVAEVLINANQNVDRYAALGYPVVPDTVGGFAGPLAGLHAGMKRASHPIVVTVPCDSPFLPTDLVARLYAALDAHRAELAVARTFDQPHPVFCLARREVLPHLEAFLAGGGRKIDAWYATLNVVEVAFDDEAAAFRNINTASELADAGTVRDSRPDHPGGVRVVSARGREARAGTRIPLSVKSPLFPRMPQPKTLRDASCADDYDPDSMPVATARALIRTFLSPVTATERVHIRQALSRVLADGVVSPLDVPGHDNSAMDGYAVRFADLDPNGETTLARVGESFAGKPGTARIGPGQCVRIFTGAVMPEGADSVVMQERASEDAGGVHIAAGALGKSGQNRRFAGEDLKAGATVFGAGQLVRPAELGMMASLGIGEVTVYRKLRVAFFSTGDELKSIGTALGSGDVYDSNRYTLYGMLTRLNCDLIDMGVVPDVPEALERAFASAAAAADVVITSGGVSVGEADFVKQLLDKLGEVLFWKIAMKPGRPLAYGKIGGAHFFGLPGNPVSVMVTFYQFVRDALLILQGQRDVAPLPMFKVPLSAPIRKAPGRTEFQRAILTADGAGGWTVRTTGDQGSGILSSMSRANCFIVLTPATGNCAAGDLVDVQLLEGLI